MYKKTVISNVSCCQFYYKYKEYVRNKPSLCNPSKQLDNSYDVLIQNVLTSLPFTVAPDNDMTITI